MIIYIAVMLFSTFVFWVADHERKYIQSGKRKVHTPLYIVGILALSIIAGGRAGSVGSDTDYYGYQIFRIAISMDWGSIWGNLMTTALGEQSFEPGYVLLNFLVSRVSHSTFWIFFVIAFLTYYLTWKGLEQFKDLFPTWISMIVYLLLFYNESFNLMRQTLAAGIVIWGLHYLRDKKYIKFTFAVLIASLFHLWAITSFVYLAVCIILKGQLSNLKKAFILLGTIILLYSLPVIVAYIVSQGWAAARIMGYFARGATVELNLNQIIIRLPAIIVGLVMYKDYAKNNLSNQSLFLIMILEMILTQANSYSVAAYRIYAFFGYSKLIIYPQLCSIKNNFINKALSKMMILFVIVLWIYNIAIANYNATIPYIWEPIVF